MGIFFLFFASVVNRQHGLRMGMNWDEKYFHGLMQYALKLVVVILKVILKQHDLNASPIK